MQHEKDRLEEILEGRDQRAERQKQLLATYHKPLISFTLNIPGAQKLSPNFALVHDLGIKRLKEELSTQGFPLLFDEIRVSSAGNEAFFIIEADPESLKLLTVKLEEQHN